MDNQQEDAGPGLMDFHDPRHPLHCPDCDPEHTDAMKEHRRNRDRAWAIVTRIPPRNSWPFPLERIPNAAEILLKRFNLVPGEPASIDLEGTCFVCGAPPAFMARLHSMTIGPFEWFDFITGLSKSDHPIKNTSIIGHGEFYGFCSSECHASAIIWSHRLPLNYGQLFRAISLFPLWAWEDHAESQRREREHREYEDVIRK
jgi:hypothetical protein